MIVSISMTELPLLERAVRQFRAVEGGRAFVEAPGALAFVATDGPVIQGWCWGHHLARPDASSMLYLHDLEVAEAHRRQGIGRRLVGAFMAAGAAAGATTLFLSTGAANAAARSLYESLGGELATQGPTVQYWFRLGE